MRVNEIEPAIHYDNWRLPNKEELRKEFKLKSVKEHYYQDLDIEGEANCWDSWENINRAVKQGKIVRLPFSKYNKIERLSGGNSLQSLHDMSLHYNSGPRDPFRIEKGFRDNDAIPIAIIIQCKDRLILTAGNTRLNAAKICNIHPAPKVLIISAEV